MHNLCELAGEYGLELTENHIKQFDVYTELLLEYNKKVNLTSITDRDDIIIKHYLDSLLTLHAYDIPHGSKVIDIGSGAGFPGVPVKILREDLDLTLLDSLNKRIVFLRELSHTLGQNNNLIHGRAETLAHDPKMRGQFDIAVSRAVASLPSLVEYCLPFLKPGGVFLALKSLDNKSELESAAKVIGLAKGELEGVRGYLLPGDIGRSIIIVRKISQTPPQYPRKRVNISKTPII